MMTDEQLKNLRDQILPWFKASVKRQFAESKEDQEEFRQDIRAAKALGPAAWWDQNFFNYAVYCAEMVDRGHGRCFTNVKFNGVPADSFTAMEEFVCDCRAVLYTSDQGNVLCVHGTPDGNICTGKDKNGEEIISTLDSLKQIVPRGTYHLVSCYNSTKDNEVLDQLAKEGWHFIKAGSSGSVTLGPIAPNHVMVVYNLTKEDLREVAGDKWDDTLYYEIPDPIMGISF